MIKYLYHRTNPENVNNILEEGLKCKSFYISLSESISAWSFLGQAVFTIDIERFIKENPSVKVTTWLPESDEICVWGNIPAEYIKEANHG